MSNDGQCLLELKNFSVAYHGMAPSVKAVDDLNIRLNKNETLGIIGESGCGKSSMAMGIMGLLSQADVSGEVIYKGEQLNGMPEKNCDSIAGKRLPWFFRTHWRY